MNKLEIQRKIDEIKARYAINPQKIWGVPKEFTSKYGCPIDIEKAREGWYCLFNRHWEKESFLFLFSADFKEYKMILERPYLFQIEYDVLNKKLFFLEIDFNSLFLLNRPQVSFDSPYNAIETFDLQSKTIDKVIAASSERPFFTFDLALSKGDVTFFDFISRKIKITDGTGNVKGSWPVPEYWINKLQYSDSGELYLTAVSKQNWFGLSISDRHDSILKWNQDHQMIKVKLSENEDDPTANRIYDLEHFRNSWFWCSSSYFGKNDEKGEVVYTQTMKEKSAWLTQSSPFYFWRLKKDKIDSSGLYAISWANGAKDNAIYRVGL